MLQSIWWSGQGLYSEQVSVIFDKRETLCISMLYAIERMYTFGIKAFKFICIQFSFTKWLWYGNLVHVGISL